MDRQHPLLSGGVTWWTGVFSDYSGFIMGQVFWAFMPGGALQTMKELCVDSVARSGI